MNNVSNARLECIYEKYERYGGGDFRRIFVSGSDMRICLIKLLDIVGLYSDPDSILEEEEEIGRKLTSDEILSKIEDQSGDGADFILCLKDDITGEILIDGSGASFEGTEYFTNEEEEELWK